MLQLLTYTTYLDFIQDGPADLPCKKGCTTNNFPLLLQDVQIELHEQEFNHNFITNFFRDSNGVPSSTQPLWHVFASLLPPFMF